MRLKQREKDFIIRLFLHHLKTNYLFRPTIDLHLADITVFNKFYYTESPSAEAKKRNYKPKPKFYTPTHYSKEDLAFEAIMRLYNLAPQNFYDLFVFADKLRKDPKWVNAQHLWEDLWIAGRSTLSDIQYFNGLKFRRYAKETGAIAKLDKLYSEHTPYYSFSDALPNIAQLYYVSAFTFSLQDAYRIKEPIVNKDHWDHWNSHTPRYAELKSKIFT